MSWGPDHIGMSHTNLLLVFAPDAESSIEENFPSETEEGELGLSLIDAVDLNLVKPSSPWMRLSPQALEVLRADIESDILQQLVDRSPDIGEIDGVQMCMYGGWVDRGSLNVHLLVALVDNEQNILMPNVVERQEFSNPVAGLLLDIQPTPSANGSVNLGYCFSSRIWGEQLKMLSTERRNESAWADLCRSAVLGNEAISKLFPGDDVSLLDARCCILRDPHSEDRWIDILVRYPEGHVLFNFHLSEQGTTLRFPRGIRMLPLFGEPKRIEITRYV